MNGESKYKTLLDALRNSDEIETYCREAIHFKFFRIYEQLINNFVRNSYQVVQVRRFQKGRIVFNQGDTIESLYLILSGELLCYDQRSTPLKEQEDLLSDRITLRKYNDSFKAVLRLQEGFVYGIQQLYGQKNTPFVIAASKNTCLLEISFNSMHKLAVQDFDFKKNKEKVQFFKHHFPKFQPEEFIPFIMMNKEFTLPPNTILFSSIDTATHLYFIKDGQIQIFHQEPMIKSQVIFESMPPDSIGEEGLFANKRYYLAKSFPRQSCKLYQVEIAEIKKYSQFLPNIIRVLENKCHSKQFLFEKQINVLKQQNEQIHNVNTQLQDSGQRNIKNQIKRFIHQTEYELDMSYSLPKSNQQNAENKSLEHFSNYGFFDFSKQIRTRYQDNWMNQQQSYQKNKSLNDSQRNFKLYNLKKLWQSQEKPLKSELNEQKLLNFSPKMPKIKRRKPVNRYTKLV